MQPKLIVANKAFVTYNDKILILREALSSQNKFDPGRYNIIGGQIEPGKSIFDSLLKAIKQECDLDVSIKRPFYINEIQPKNDENNWHLICSYFECPSSSDNIKLGPNFDDFIWIEPKDFRQYYLFKELHEPFEYYLRDLKNL